MDTFDNNLCVWRCLAIYKRHTRGETNQLTIRNCRIALDLARECYGDNKLKRKDLKPTKYFDFEDIARYHNVNMMLYEPIKDRGKDAGFTWCLVYDKIQ